MERDRVTEQFTPDGTAVHTMAATYTVNALHGVEGGGSWAVTVTWIGSWEYGRPRPEDQQWTVEHIGKRLGRDGTWDWDHSERSDDWNSDHRFSLEEALKLAQEAAPRARFGGMTAAEALEWKRQNPDGAL